MKLGIVGTAGRGEDGIKFTRDKYIEAFNIIYRYIVNSNNLGEPITELISGGAAYADHIAVLLFLNNWKSNKNAKPQKLTLHLPEEFTTEYIESKNGAIANYYHQYFSNRVGQDSFKHIVQAREAGANIEVTYGFKERNSRIAIDSDFLIAATFGAGPKVKDGGTRDTFLKFTALKGDNCARHLDLNTLILHPNAI